MTQGRPRATPLPVVLLLPVLGDARLMKRRALLERAGASTVSLGFERETGVVEGWPPRVERLGLVEEGRLLRRLGPYLRALPRIRRELRHARAVMAFGSDLGLLAWLAGRGLPAPPPLVVEVADVREPLLRSGPSGWVLRWLERFVLRRARCVVTTSPEFAESWFVEQQGLQPSQLMVIENKLMQPLGGPLSPAPFTARGEGRLRIGWHGLLRCRRSLELLRELVTRWPDRFEVHVRGVACPPVITEAELETTPGFRWEGPYRSPEDLAELMEPIDLCWAAHLHGKSNALWARATRGYEALHFARPVVLQEGTPDARRFEEWDVGLRLDLRRRDDCLARLGALEPSMLRSWQRRMSVLPRFLGLHSSEHEEILNRIG
ncbi:MAG: glycosyltransferase [Acidobacteriota bacterium]